MKIVQKIRNQLSSNKAGLQLIIIRLLGMFLAYVFMTLITRFLGAAVFGRFSLVQTILQLLSLVLSFGFFNSVIQLTNNKVHFRNHEIQSNYFRQSIDLLFVASLFSSALLIVFREWIAFHLFHDEEFTLYITFLAISLPFFNLLRYFSEFMAATDRFKMYSLINYFYPNLFSIILLGAFLWLVPNALSSDMELNLSFFVPFVVIFIFLLLYMRKDIFQSGVQKIISKKELILFSFPMMVGVLFIFLNNWTDVLMLGGMVDKSDLGIYNAAYKMASLGQVVLVSFNTVYATQIARLYNDNRIDELKKATYENIKIVSILSLPIMIYFFIFPGFSMQLFGEEFIQGKTSLVILCVGFSFNIISASAGTLLLMSGNQVILQNTTLVTAGINIVLNFVLIPIWGINGAALASTITIFTLNALVLYYVYKKFNFVALWGINK